MKGVGMCPPLLQIQEKNLIDEGRGHVPTFFQN